MSGNNEKGGGRGRNVCDEVSDEVFDVVSTLLT